METNPARPDRSVDEPPEFGRGSTPTVADGWAAARPRHPDGSPAVGAFDTSTWWPRYQYRFAAPTHGVAPSDQPEVRRPVVPAGVEFGGSAADLTDDLIVRSRAQRPTRGWRRAV
ncbi:MAG: hypothetical protein ACT4O0_14890, partial [Pseudonocardia sp.]